MSTLTNAGATMHCGFGVSVPAPLSVTGTFVPDQWTHAAGVYNGKTLQLYVNGKPAGTLAAAGPTLGDLTGLRFGGPEEAPWEGALDEIRIYKRVLTAAEIVKLHAQ